MTRSSMARASMTQTRASMTPLIVLLFYITAAAALRLKAISATMSSIYSEKYQAERCIDGMEDGILCHSLAEKAPWLALDFGAEVTVDRISIHNRDDCCGYRLRNVKVRVANQLPSSGQVMFSGGQLLASFPGPANDGQVVTLTSSAELAARYVIIQIDNSPGTEYLNLNEVTVWGKKTGDYTLVSVPWARGAALNFNDSTASTLSTVGNAALLLGGLYLLSGFPAAAALADPFGFSKRLGAASLPRGPINFQHRSSSGEEAFIKKSKMEKIKRPSQKRPSKMEKMKRPSQKTRPDQKTRPSQFKHVASFLRTSPPQQKPVNRQGSANSPSKATKGGPKEHRASERQQRPRF